MPDDHELSSSYDVKLDSYSLSYDFSWYVDPWIIHSLEDIDMFGEMVPTTFESSSSNDVKLDAYSSPPWIFNNSYSCNLIYFMMIHDEAMMISNPPWEESHHPPSFLHFSE